MSADLHTRARRLLGRRPQPARAAVARQLLKEYPDVPRAEVARAVGLTRQGVDAAMSTVFARPGRPSSGEHRRVTLRLPPDVVERLHLEAAESGHSVSRVVETMARLWQALDGEAKP